MTMVLVAVAMVAIVAMAALSIDVVTLYLARMEAQRAADAGALAAARVISVSGMTGDTGNATGSWASICGGSASVATHAADAAATQGSIDGALPTTTTVKYSAGPAPATPNPDCSGLPAEFAVNPMVTVQVTRNNLPTFFSRLWGNTGNTVNATAVAEAFNSSNSGNETNGAATGTIIPVQPRCVKPWLVPNLDPLYLQPTHGNYCNQPSGPGACLPLVNISDGALIHPGISPSSGANGVSGVIGETFWLSPVCTHTGGRCIFRPNANPPTANYTGSPYAQGPPNLTYAPAQAPTTSPVAVPHCSGGSSPYQQAVAGCDQSTLYQCGKPTQNTVQLSENPDIDTSEGVACLIHEGSTTGAQPDGQDTINDSAYPFQILAGSSNPLVGAGLASGTQITASNSIVSVPIYDSTNPSTLNGSGTTSVTIVGFLQVFINQVDQYGSINVTVLNVTGCSNGTGQTVGTAVTGSSPVPVRLITAP
jgi:Putative Flp pilus-assembly TadE/G-like